VNRCLAALLGVLLLSPAVRAQAPPAGPCSPSDAPAARPPGGEAASDDDRLLGVLPNYTTVGAHQEAPPLCTKLLFTLAFKSTFDRNMYPFVGLRALLAQLSNNPESWGQGADAYAKRFGAIFADNGVSAYMTTALVPLMARQDPRYYVKGEGGAWHRIWYAMTRAVVTRSRDGKPQFNVSEIGGAAAAAGLSNLYYPSDSRSGSETLQRWGTNVMWDTLSYELREFWPDIRRKIVKH
jgi:hypothetical protein